MKFIEDQRGDATQLRIGQHLTKKNALGDEEDFRFLGGDIVETDLVSDFSS